MWGGWDEGGMMGHHDWDALHMWGSGYGAAWTTGHPGAFGHWLTMRGQADRRRDRLAASLQPRPQEQRGADGLVRPCAPTIAGRSSPSTATTT